MTLMKALLARDYGPPDTFSIEQLPIPEPGPGQVQVRVRAASLNPADLLMAAGTVREMVPLNFPHVPGTDFAGTVTKLGPDVDGFAEGEEVFGFGAPPSFAAGVGIAAVTTGAMAEYAAFQVDGPYVAVRPEGLSAELAAALPSTGMKRPPSPVSRGSSAAARSRRTPERRQVGGGSANADDRCGGECVARLERKRKVEDVVE